MILEGGKQPDIKQVEYVNLVKKNGPSCFGKVFSSPE